MIIVYNIKYIILQYVFTSLLRMTNDIYKSQKNPSGSSEPTPTACHKRSETRGSPPIRVDEKLPRLTWCCDSFHEHRKFVVWCCSGGQTSTNNSWSVCCCKSKFGKCVYQLECKRVEHLGLRLTSRPPRGCCEMRTANSWSRQWNSRRDGSQLTGVHGIHHPFGHGWYMLVPSLPLVFPERPQEKVNAALRVDKGQAGNFPEIWWSKTQRMIQNPKPGFDSRHL